jgi:hypothetical protein
MSRVAFIKGFFAQFHSLNNELIEMFPEDPDFPTFKTFLSMLEKTNPTLVLKTFHENVSDKFAKEIVARDESFFMNYVASEYDNETVDIVDKMRTYWKTLSPESKDCLWKYLFVLKELCERATG